MVIIFPNEVDGLRNIEENLNKINFDYRNYLGEKNQREIKLFLPKFKINTSVDLIEQLKNVRLYFKMLIV